MRVLNRLQSELDYNRGECGNHVEQHGLLRLRRLVTDTSKKLRETEEIIARASCPCAVRVRIRRAWKTERARRLRSASRVRRGRTVFVRRTTP